MFMTSIVRRRAEPPHDTQDKSAYRPVPRTERLNRLENSPEERLRRLAKNVDTWTESRSDKSIWQSWLGLGALADYLEKQYPVHNNRTTLHNTAKPHLQDGDENSPRFFSISVVDHKQ